MDTHPAISQLVSDISVALRPKEGGQGLRAALFEEKLKEGGVAVALRFLRGYDMYPADEVLFRRRLGRHYDHVPHVVLNYHIVSGLLTRLEAALVASATLAAWQLQAVS